MTMVWTVYEDMFDDLMATFCTRVHLRGENSEHVLFPSTIATVADAGLLLPLMLPIWYIVVYLFHWC